jgi:hypothetical protein
MDDVWIVEFAPRFIFLSEEVAEEMLDSVFGKELFLNILLASNTNKTHCSCRAIAFEMLDKYFTIV